jgi:hypothetical protein
MRTLGAGRGTVQEHHIWNAHRLIKQIDKFMPDIFSKLKLLAQNLNPEPQVNIDILGIPVEVLGAVVWRAGAAADEIEKKDGKLKYYREACELVTLTDCVNSALEKGDHFLDLPDRVHKYRKLGTRWYREFESKRRNQQRLVNGSFN